MSATYVFSFGVIFVTGCNWYDIDTNRGSHYHQPLLFDFVELLGLKRKKRMVMVILT